MERSYTVAIYSTPMSFPLNFTCHTWIEISHNNTTQRFDFWGYPGIQHGDKSKNYIYRNIFPNHLGTTFSPFADPGHTKNRQTGKIHQSITGAQHSTAHRLYQAIFEKAFEYPFDKNYHMIFGPNCNTFTQWLLDLVPAHQLTLPWNAWGKGVSIRCK